MTQPQPEKPLKLVKIFKDTKGYRHLEKNCDQYGYQKVDDMQVLNRQIVPVLLGKKWGGDEFHLTEKTEMVIVTLYDFNSHLITIMHECRVDQGDKGMQHASTGIHSVMPFSAVEGKQSIRDAHRALTELGGAPPPLSEILDEKNSSVFLKNGVQSAPKLFKGA